MTGTAVVAMGCGAQQSPVDVPVVARSVRAMADAGWNVVLVAPIEPPGADLAGRLALAVGQSRSGRRAVTVVTHTLVDPADPALARPPATAYPAPLAILEAEAIAALAESGFAVVVAGQVPVVPFGDDYRPLDVALDGAAAAQRLAGDLGAAALVFCGYEGSLLAGGPTVGEIDVVEAEHRLAADPPFGSELRAAVRFLRAGGELAVINAGARRLRIRRTLARPHPEGSALNAGWC
ncbi:MAG TPA: hypothetical protein VGR20_00370 [Acidimicrobiia bacterium]|jgi:carbamate kinase|nr:hypothetical protein [Acidimicrobiia bacterium]